MNDDERLRLARRLTDALPAPEEIRDDWGLFIMDTVLPNGVWSRPGLSQRDRSMITIAALTACPGGSRTVSAARRSES